MQSYFNIWKLINITHYTDGASLVAQMVKESACNVGDLWSLVQEDPLEKEMATHSSIFAWSIPWTEEPGGLQSMESQRVRHDCLTKTQA